MRLTIPVIALLVLPLAGCADLISAVMNSTASGRNDGTLEYRRLERLDQEEAADKAFKEHTRRAEERRKRDESKTRQPLPVKVYDPSGNGGLSQGGG